MTKKRYNEDIELTWEIGKKLYWEGVNNYQVVHRGIRQIGLYLWRGDKEMGITPMKDDNEGRAKLILKTIRKWLHWSKEKVKELWKDIWGTVTWRKYPIDKPLPIPELHNIDSTNSISSSNSIKTSTTNTIEESEKTKLSREEILGIMRQHLPKSMDLDKPNGMTSLMLKAIGLKT